MENIEGKYEQQEELDAISTTQEAVSRFIDDGDAKTAIDYLRTHKEDITEFCLQVRDTYGKSDNTTGFVKLAQLIEKLI